MTAYQFMLEMELYPYSKDNFEMTKLMNQIELQEMALNARDAIKYNDLNEEALAYISETVEAANLKVEYFSEGKDDDKSKDDEKEDGFFKKIWANIVKFWKWIWNNISYIFKNIGRFISKLFKSNKNSTSMDLKGLEELGLELLEITEKKKGISEKDLPSALVKRLKEMLEYKGDDIEELIRAFAAVFRGTLTFPVTSEIDFISVNRDIDNLYEFLKKTTNANNIMINNSTIAKIKNLSSKLCKSISNNNEHRVNIDKFKVYIEDTHDNSDRLAKLAHDLSESSDLLDTGSSKEITEFNKWVKAIHTDLTNYSTNIMNQIKSYSTTINEYKEVVSDIISYLKK